MRQLLYRPGKLSLDSREVLQPLCGGQPACLLPAPPACLGVAVTGTIQDSLLQSGGLVGVNPLVLLLPVNGGKQTF